MNRNDALFDFARYAADVGQSADLIRQFAAHDAFRSATVEELVLEDDFHRRPLRPEDLSFIDFHAPVKAETITQLPSLASQRLLLCINELDATKLPADRSADRLQRIADYYKNDSKILAARINGFLEAFAFDHLTHAAPVRGVDGMRETLREIVRNETAFWSRIFAALGRQNYITEGVRFALIQKWCLAASKRSALAKAEVTGRFDGLSPDAWPRLTRASSDDDAIKRIAEACGVTRDLHSYWQFYLSTSLASTNLLYGLAARPQNVLDLYGAAFAAEAEWLAFGCFVGQAAQYLKLESFPLPASDPAAELMDRFERMLRGVERLFGERGITQVGHGMAIARELGLCARRDLGEQLSWLSAIERYRGIAEAIDRRIAAEYPNIDRETFVEPREMCSTTHVHDDHRLVVIESGRMVFWGNLGMTLELDPGEMVLVPQGRLHGSSVLSPECVYHQPIIPDVWVDELVSEKGMRIAS
jgi:hypothetical protein